MEIRSLWVDLGTAVRVCNPCPRLHNHSGCRDKHNRQRWYSNLGPLTQQLYALPLDYCWVSWVENVLLIYWFVYIGNWFVYIGKNPRFTAFLDSNLHTWLAIVTANELGLAFPPRNLPKKFRPDPSTFYLVIVVTNKQTDRQTSAGDYIIPSESFRGDNKLSQRGRLDDMPPADGSLTCGGSMSIRVRVRSPHISGGRPAAGSQHANSLGWHRLTDCGIA